MKNLSLPLLFVGMAYSVAQADPLPADAQKLMNERDAAFKKIDRGFQRELEAVKARCLRDGDLDGANAVAALITQLPPAFVPAEEDPLIGSVWNFLGTEQQKINQLTFLASGDVDCEHSYAEATWQRLDEKTILFSYGTEGSYAVLMYADDSRQLMSGSTRSGRERYLKWVK